MGYLLLSFSLVFNAFANILMKMGAKNIGYFTEYGLVGGVIRNYHFVLGIV